MFWSFLLKRYEVNNYERDTSSTKTKTIFTKKKTQFLPIFKGLKKIDFRAQVSRFSFNQTHPAESFIPTQSTFFSNKTSIPTFSFFLLLLLFLFLLPLLSLASPWQSTTALNIISEDSVSKLEFPWVGNEIMDSRATLNKIIISLNENEK